MLPHLCAACSRENSLVTAENIFEKLMDWIIIWTEAECFVRRNHFQNLQHDFNCFCLVFKAFALSFLTLCLYSTSWWRSSCCPIFWHVILSLNVYVEHMPLVLYAVCSPGLWSIQKSTEEYRPEFWSLLEKKLCYLKISLWCRHNHILSTASIKRFSSNVDKNLKCLIFSSDEYQARSITHLAITIVNGLPQWI